MADGWNIESLQHGAGLLVILGAGASFDCLPSPGRQGITPPLTKDLAWGDSVLVSHYPMVRPLLGDLRTRLRSASRGGEPLTLENGLSEYLERREFDVNVPRHVAAMRFYLRDLLWNATNAVMAETGGITNYTAFVTSCIHWALRTQSHVCFVSFNYDPLLEIALQDHGRPLLGAVTPFAGSQHASVIKPHGSVLWAWSQSGFVASRNINNPKAQAIQAGEPKTDRHSRIFSSDVPQDVVTLDDGLMTPAIPALALPMANKSELVWPKEQETFFLTELPRGAFGRVLTIGWRAAEPHFTHLLDHLIVPRAKYVIVGGNDDDARETFSNFHSALPVKQKGTVEQDGNGFRRLVEDRELLDSLLA